jgi:hypothetical protein
MMVTASTPAAKGGVQRGDDFSATGRIGPGQRFLVAVFEPEPREIGGWNRP